MNDAVAELARALARTDTDAKSGKPALFLALRREALTRAADHAAKVAVAIGHSEGAKVLADFDDVATDLGRDRDAAYRRYWEETSGPDAGNDDAFRTATVVGAVHAICAHMAQSCSLVGFLDGL